jgi:EAL domain-containing protein (putative c-di-GMP-specific phosphodiesterase class I)
MYKAKEQGRDNYQFYSQEMTQKAMQRVEMENELRVAIEHKNFQLFYQPQYTTKKQLVGMEALVRWIHPTKGVISPAEFIPLAQENGMIIAIDTIVMQEAIAQFKQWYNKGYTPGILALNLSMKHLEQEGFISKLLQTIEENNFNPKWLELEVTEGEIMKNPQSSIQKLKQLNSYGIQIAIDDFGTGYSSLSYLKKLPLDKLKIDQSFVRDLAQDEDDQAIIKAIIALGKSLKLSLIAEGVETQEQLDFLQMQRCDSIQGYYFSKPLPASEIETNEFLS